MEEDKQEMSKLLPAIYKVSQQNIGTGDSISNKHARQANTHQGTCKASVVELCTFKDPSSLNSDSPPLGYLHANCSLYL